MNKSTYSNCTTDLKNSTESESNRVGYPTNSKPVKHHRMKMPALIIYASLNHQVNTEP